MYLAYGRCLGEVDPFWQNVSSSTSSNHHDNESLNDSQADTELVLLGDQLVVQTVDGLHVLCCR